MSELDCCACHSDNDASIDTLIDNSYRSSMDVPVLPNSLYTYRVTSRLTFGSTISKLETISIVAVLI